MERSGRQGSAGTPWPRALRVSTPCAARSAPHAAPARPQRPPHSALWRCHLHAALLACKTQRMMSARELHAGVPFESVAEGIRTDVGLEEGNHLHDQARPSGWELPIRIRCTYTGCICRRASGGPTSGTGPGTCLEKTCHSWHTMLAVPST